MEKKHHISITIIIYEYDDNNNIIDSRIMVGIAVNITIPVLAHYTIRADKCSVRYTQF